MAARPDFRVDFAGVSFTFRGQTGALVTAETSARKNPLNLIAGNAAAGSKDTSQP